MDVFNECVKKVRGLFKMSPLCGLQIQGGSSRPVHSATGCISEEPLWGTTSSTVRRGRGAKWSVRSVDTLPPLGHRWSSTWHFTTKCKTMWDTQTAGKTFTTAMRPQCHNYMVWGLGLGDEGKHIILYCHLSWHCHHHLSSPAFYFSSSPLQMKNTYIVQGRKIQFFF